MSTPLKHLKQIQQALETQLITVRKDIERIELDQGREMAVKDHFRRLKSVGREVAKAAGYDKSKLSDAAKTVDLPADISTATAIHHAKATCDTQAAHQKALRNREIIRLARRGYTNGEIANQLHVSKRTITRVITAEIRTP
jgi:DNA-binding NarL/FixJ family response regulator